MNDIYEMMSTLRAVRRLRSDPIPDDVLDRVLQAAAWAPTGGNMQPWRVVVVRSPERKQALADVYQPAWYRYAKGYDARNDQLPPEEAAKGSDALLLLTEWPEFSNVNFASLRDTPRGPGDSDVRGGSEDDGNY